MSKPRFNPLYAALAFVALVGFFFWPFGGHGVVSSGPAGSATSKPDAGHVTHVVLFEWKTAADPDAVVMAHKRLMALRTKCIHPTRKQPYIVSLKGGRDHSPEGLQHGATHGYVVEFASIEDRDYYVKTDPAHKAFVGGISDIVEKATVLDFTAGFY
ncbi:hypothetical protein RB594_008630 [Gaeumannomyces avenae]